MEEQIDPMNSYPQIKICGLTVPEEAAATAALGADAIGLVFFPPSPRHLELDQAERVAAALPPEVVPVGVFVNPTMDELGETIQRCGLGMIQLHGNEPPSLVRQIQERFSIRVMKGLFAAKSPSMADAETFSVAAYLVECGKGPLPGGNAEAWNWAEAAEFIKRHPTALAGGLAPDNVKQAIAAALPDAVDASSGLEASPGRKDLKKVEGFIAAVRETASFFQEQGRQPRPVFVR